MSQQDYSLRERIQTDACTACCLCADVCPAVSAAWDGRLSGAYRLGMLKRITRCRAGLLRRLYRWRMPTAEQVKAFSDTVFRCTLCGRCQEACPVGIGLKDIWISLRQDLVRSRAYPDKVDRIRSNLLDTHNVFAEDNDERACWVEDIPGAPDHGYLKDRAEVVYFTGCVSAYFPMVQNIPIALAGILERLGVDFTLLGPEEWCCGFPMLGAGLRDEAWSFIEHNMETVRKRGARKVVFACPTCYQMWREYYPPGPELLHVTEFLAHLLASSPARLGDVPLTVTYHDPCDLGRAAGVFEAPREILRSIPGLDLVELPRNREDCACCGGGGNLEMMDPELAGKIARRKVEEVLGTGAGAVVTACQQCVRTMNTFVRRNKIPLQVLDVVQVVHRSLGKQ